jgi:glycosyltransferase involved in cell wall biosynthesis
VKILTVVTLVSPLGEYGGPLRVAVNQSKALIERGHSVTIAGSFRGYDQPPTDVEGVPARLFPSHHVIPGSGHAGLASPGLWRWLLGAASDFDVAHIHLARDLVTLPTARVAGLRGLRYVVQAHGMIDESSRLMSKPLDAALTLPALRRAHRVLYLSGQERDDLIAVAKRVPLDLVALPNGVPTTDDVQPGESFGTEVLYLGRLTPRKRPTAFVRMAEALSPEFPDVQFTLVGPDDGEGDAVGEGVDGAAARGVRVAWEGPIPPAETINRMGRAAIYVLPAVNEPYPMSVLEAMSVGLPVVVTESCGLAEFVQTSEAGVVVGEDEESLVSAVRQLLSDSFAAQCAGDRGRMAVRAERSMDSIAARLEQAYND